MKALLLMIMLITYCSSSTADICPKGNSPAETLYVADVSTLPMDEQLFFSSLQGVTAQRQPQIYLIRDIKEDQFWLDWMLEKGYIKRINRVDYWKLSELAQRYGFKIKYDLRRKWTRNTEAYRWALNQMGDKLNRFIVCSLYPFAAQHRIRDYLVQHTVFTLHPSTAVSECLQKPSGKNLHPG